MPWAGGFVGTLHTRTEDCYGGGVTGVVTNEVDAAARVLLLPEGAGPST